MDTPLRAAMATTAAGSSVPSTWICSSAVGGLSQPCPAGEAPGSGEAPAAGMAPLHGAGRHQGNAAPLFNSFAQPRSAPACAAMGRPPHGRNRLLAWPVIASASVLHQLEKGDTMHTPVLSPRRL